MSAQYMHIGIPVTDKKENMTYNEDLKLWMTNPDDYDFKIEYLKFEEGTPFPSIMHKNPHIAYKVDDLEFYMKDSDRVIVEPIKLDENTRIAFIIKDDTIIELFEQK